MSLFITYSCIEYTSQWKGIKLQADAGENSPTNRRQPTYNTKLRNCITYSWIEYTHITAIGNRTSNFNTEGFNTPRNL